MVGAKRLRQCVERGSDPLGTNARSLRDEGERFLATPRLVQPLDVTLYLPVSENEHTLCLFPYPYRRTNRMPGYITSREPPPGQDLQRTRLEDCARPETRGQACPTRSPP